jgi:hypothetical protein
VLSNLGGYPNYFDPKEQEAALAAKEEQHTESTLAYEYLGKDL